MTNEHKREREQLVSFFASVYSDVHLNIVLFLTERDQGLLQQYFVKQQATTPNKNSTWSFHGVSARNLTQHLLRGLLVFGCIVGGHQQNAGKLVFI